MYCVGIMILLIGVAVLVQQRVAAKPPEVIRDDSSDSLLENDMGGSEQEGVSITPTSPTTLDNNADNKHGPSELVIT
jgi:hypothetical protein